MIHQDHWRSSIPCPILTYEKVVTGTGKTRSSKTIGSFILWSIRLLGGEHDCHSCKNGRIVTVIDRNFIWVWGQLVADLIWIQEFLCRFESCHPDIFSGVAKLVSRCIWDAEIVGSSPATATEYRYEVKRLRCRPVTAFGAGSTPVIPANL